MEREIARGLAGGLRQPQFEAGERVVRTRRAAHLDEGGGAADERGAAAGFVGVLRERAHERQVDVNVRIDEARENVFARGVDDFSAGWGVKVPADSCDGFALAEDVG